ncbi:MAG: tetratricopeptide repeat protein [Alphaproteobacteria bacterium]|jgi:tetratricopeptide (TPR) repeat protein|nr:tetratricopeptide repeat protein [Alphaproteobacteria bacterium]
MRQLALVMAILFGLSSAGGVVLASQDDARLDSLFDALQTTDEYIVAAQAERDIWAAWTDTGDPDLNRLMVKGSRAMVIGRFDMAMEAFDTIIEAVPNLAEGWNKRATLYYLMGEPAASIRDIEKTLELEPRHFGALSGLGLVHLAAENYPAALDAFEAALVVHPRMASAIRYVRELRLKLYGPEV